MHEVENFFLSIPNPWTLRMSGMGGYTSKCEKVKITAPQCTVQYVSFDAKTRAKRSHVCVPFNSRISTRVAVNSLFLLVNYIVWRSEEKDPPDGSGNNVQFLLPLSWKRIQNISFYIFARVPASEKGIQYICTSTIFVHIISNLY